MFAHLTTYVTVASVALLAVATPHEKRWNTPTTTPATTKTITASDPLSTLLLGLLGIVIDGLDVVLGIQCSPISVIGVAGGDCDANVVCCQDNNVGGLISIGCIPVIL
ncbi:hypothetical protein BN946_scf184806.g40 [Trametes cinnabarina]|uniref:Hydrophobin n=1 Tax=Pycnoporus cinnabarinus TaxID=5643 RepID=A0A060SCJ8_PYCCI|nr:hypothetical protein BN946_scf184806.g40 [Trametes cinnabarina]